MSMLRGSIGIRTRLETKDCNELQNQLEVFLQVHLLVTGLAIVDTIVGTHLRVC